MTFALTDELITSIISAMENQDEDFLIDAESGLLVEADQKADEEKYYDLPDWTAADGFAMRESFVAKLHAPLARDELQQVLHSGRGVFKNFRNVLKNYPEVDKRWHIFKHNTMSVRINEWYNVLCEIWGLEKLDHFSESDESLVHDDFSFYKYDSSADLDEILLNISACFNDDEDLPNDVQSVVYDLWLGRFKTAELAGQTGFVCRSLSEDFAGCITASSFTNNQEKVMVITLLFVTEQYRGLGIAAELIAMLINECKNLGKKWIFMPEENTPNVIEPLLIRTGFEKKLGGYLLAA
ncbi:MAG: GNAT family N-acetyltransferase [Treponema sp.]|nr:GNAT family N-acetyltransferase [Treponema sp.]